MEYLEKLALTTKRHLKQINKLMSSFWEYSIMVFFGILYFIASIEMSKNQNTNTTILNQILDNQTEMLETTNKILNKLENG